MTKPNRDPETPAPKPPATPPDADDPGDDLEPELTTPAGRFWDIEIPERSAAALRVRGL
jgi:hypothetical protein